MLGEPPAGSGGGPPGFLMGRERITGKRAHGLAASCLYGQPFGFTRYDVMVLRGVSCLDGPFRTCHAELNDLADRIEALLPPSEGA